MNFEHEELRIKPTREQIGWTVQETIGIGIVNTPSFWTWCKKMFYKLFFKSMKQKMKVKELMKESEWKEWVNRQVG